jgi:hypothetical protein
MYYELKVELVRVNPQTNDVVRTYGSIPIHGDLQDHIEMAGRAAAVQAYFAMLQIRNIRKP